MASAIELLTQSGVVITGVSLVWKFVLVRPLEKSEAREEKLQAKYDLLATEFKANNEALKLMLQAKEEEAGKPRSLPPPRPEMPTIAHIVDSQLNRREVAEFERSRQNKLNPSTEHRQVLPEGLMSGKARLPPFAGKADYDAHNVDRMTRGDNTPTELRSKNEKKKR